MPSFIFYCTDDNIKQTIDDFLDKTPPDLIEEIIVCDDGGGIDQNGVIVLKTDTIGRAKAWNAAAEQAVSKTLVFLRHPIKFGKDWLPPILEAMGDKIILSPVVHSLDLALWSTEYTNQCRFGIRWNLAIYNRPTVDRRSPVLPSYCMVVRKARFDEIGCFDDGMGMGPGEDIEFSIRNWLFGGEAIVVDDSYIATALDGTWSLTKFARIVEAWMSKYSTFFYQVCGVDSTDVKVGRLNRLENLKVKQERDIDWWIENLQPELVGIYPMKGVAAGKSIAVVGGGPSLDYMRPADIEKHDIIIGVDYAGDIYKCDYIITDFHQVIDDLGHKYADEQFVVPFVMQSKGRRFIQFDQCEYGRLVDSVDPPFCNFGDSALVAVHFALFMNPRSITLFGCDNRIIDGKSHASKISYYCGGKVWPDSESIRNRLALYEAGLSRFGKIAHIAGIPLLRIAHV